MDSAPALAALTARLEGAARITLDTEADSLHSYYEKVCLIQLSVGGESYIVDPLAGVDLSGFLGALAARPLLFHGADYDLRMLRASFGFRPQGDVYDTMIAAQLLGLEEFGLAALARRLCGVTLTKAGQKADWSRRPLTRAQLAYATDDIRYLEPIADALFTELRRLGRYDWYRDACGRLVASTARERPRDPAEAWRIKGLKGFDRRQLAFVRELWRWREHEAQKADRPAFKVLGNAQLRELALWGAAHPAASLAHGPKLPRNCTGHRLHALEAALRRARETPKSDWPTLSRGRRGEGGAPKCEREVDALMAECARIAADLGIAPSMLAPRAALEAVAHHRPQTFDDILACAPLMRWQAELLAAAILRTLSGDRAKGR